MTDDAIIVSDRDRAPITAKKRESGGVVLRSARSWIALGPDELRRLFDFAYQPRLGELARFPAPQSTLSD